MPKRPNIDRPVHLNLAIPESVRAQLDLHLFSEAEGRVPHGAYSRFLSERIQEYFTWRRLGLGAYGMPEGFFVCGPKEMLGELVKKMEKGL